MGFEDLRRVLSSLGFSPFTAITISFDCKSLNKGLEKDVQLSQLLEELEGKLKYKFKNRALLLHALISDDYAEVVFDNFLHSKLFNELFGQFEETTDEESYTMMRSFTCSRPFETNFPTIEAKIKQLNDAMSGEMGNERFVFLGKNLINFLASEFYITNLDFDEGNSIFCFILLLLSSQSEMFRATSEQET